MAKLKENLMLAIHQIDVRKKYTQKSNGKQNQSRESSYGSTRVLDMLEDQPDPEIDNLKRKCHFENMIKLEKVIKHLKEDKRKEKDKYYLKSYLKYLMKFAHFDFIQNAEEYIFRLEIGKELDRSGVIIALCDITIDILNSISHSENTGIHKNDMTALSYSLSILSSFSNSFQEHTTIIRNHTKFLEKTTDHLRNVQDQYMDNKQNFTIVLTLLVITNNISIFEENISKLRSLNYVEVLTPYLNSPAEHVQMIVTSGIANIADESDCGILHRESDILNFLTKVLRCTTESDGNVHPQLNWPMLVILKVVRKLARNDTIKKAMMDHGFLQIMVQITGSKDLQEQIEAMHILRTLCFDKEIQKHVTTDTDLGVIDAFVTKQSSTDVDVADISKVALLTLRKELITHEGYQSLDILKKITQMEEKYALEARNCKSQVMLSYQWSNLQTVVKVRDYLRSRGFKVKMRRHEQAGSRIESIIQAVEKAEVILICISRKYKDSDNCRAEAEYVIDKGKPIIPLRIEPGYEAEGWLRNISETETCYDFDGTSTSDTKTSDLVEKIWEILSDCEIKGPKTHPEKIVPKTENIPQENDEKVVTSNGTPDPSHEEEQTTYMAIKLWTQENVASWLDKHDLDRSKFEKLTGVEIAYLKYLFEKSPDFFNKALVEELKIKDLLTKSKFTCALTDLNI